MRLAAVTIIVLHFIVERVVREVLWLQASDDQ
jgi:hypothetical protein